MNQRLRGLRSLLYIINVLWSAFLIWEAYRQTADVLTALLTVVILLGAMILNDLLK